MMLPGLGRIKRGWRYMSAPFRAQILILMYHRVCEVSSDPWNLCVSPRHFAEQVESLAQNYQVISLSNLVRALKERRLPKRAVVITFDDGYADNFWNAKPVLEKFDVPGTVFVTTGYLGKEGEFWWDELERLVLLTPTLPPRLEVKIRGVDYSWVVDGSSQLSNQSLNLFLQKIPHASDHGSSRYAAYQHLHPLIQPLSEKTREAVMQELRDQIEINGKSRPSYRPMTPEEVSSMAEGGLVEIGAHTVTHSLLPVHSKEIQYHELLGSKQSLENLLGRPVTLFGYPYGGTDSSVAKQVQEVGYEAACTIVEKPVFPGSNPFQLPRCGVGDWDGEKLAKKLQVIFKNG